MEQGLAAPMVYGEGEGQSTKHYYAGDKKSARKKNKSKKKVKNSCNQ